MVLLPAFANLTIYSIWPSAESINATPARRAEFFGFFLEYEGREPMAAAFYLKSGPLN
jgi:hypothetical protein